jgi:hypothetical protein
MIPAMQGIIFCYKCQGKRFPLAENYCFLS